MNTKQALYQLHSSLSTMSSENMSKLSKIFDALGEAESENLIQVLEEVVDLVSDASYETGLEVGANSLLF